MRKHLLRLGALAGMFLFGCANGTAEEPAAVGETAAAGDGGAGGSGAHDGGSPVVGAGGSPQTCDSGFGMSAASEACMGCAFCSIGASCGSLFQALLSDPGWEALDACAGACQSQCDTGSFTTCGDGWYDCLGYMPDAEDACAAAPAGTCLGDNPSGCAAAMAFWTCATCEACPGDCGAPEDCVGAPLPPLQ